MNLVPAAALLGSVSLCLFPPFVDRAALSQNPKKDDVPTYSGLVGEWFVAVPGRVQFQVLGSGRDLKDGKSPDLWFETPADKDINTLYENLVLDVIIHASTKGLPVVVEAKNSSGDDGSVSAKAFDVVRVGIGRT